jgi:hypothetical protein
VQSLLLLEVYRLPRHIWEPAAGDGAIVTPLRAAGRFVVASDIHDYGLLECGVLNYLTARTPPDIEGLVTNPPYAKAQAFAEKATAEVPYVALLVRTNLLTEGGRRGKWLDSHPPTREWHSAQRLPMMHRTGGPGSSRAATRRTRGWCGSGVRNASFRSVSIGDSCSDCRSKRSSHGCCNTRQRARRAEERELEDDPLYPRAAGASEMDESR